MRRLLLFILCAVIAFAANAHDTQRPKSIILLIADGAGPAHFTVGKILRGKDFQIGRMPVAGLVNTSPLIDSQVTDSAASATAIATGVRTRYRAVGVDADGKPHRTILELAESLGKATGLVTTAAFFDATPASFAAHHKSRYESEAIIRQMLSSGADLIAGAGLEYFGASGRPEARDVAASGRYALAGTVDEIRAAKGDRVLALFRGEKRDGDFKSAPLADLARAAIDRLSKDPDGFFLMIEHEGTDSASHNGDTEIFTSSMLSFDDAVGVALDYASKRPDVLVVVTADHETGGLQIGTEKKTGLELKWATGGHTGEAVPLFASGPGAMTLTGFMEGEELGQRLQRFWK